MASVIQVYKWEKVSKLEGGFRSNPEAEPSFESGVKMDWLPVETENTMSFVLDEGLKNPLVVNIFPNTSIYPEEIEFMIPRDVQVWKAKRCKRGQKFPAELVSAHDERFFQDQEGFSPHGLGEGMHHTFRSAWINPDESGTLVFFYQQDNSDQVNMGKVEIVYKA